MAERLNERNDWTNLSSVKLSAHIVALASLLWSTFFWLLFFYMNAFYINPVRLGVRQLLQISGASLVLAAAAAFFRSKLSWVAVPVALLTFSFLMYMRFYVVD
jgi:hypothetical protein